MSVYLCVMSASDVCYDCDACEKVINNRIIKCSYTVIVQWLGV